MARHWFLRKRRFSNAPMLERIEPRVLLAAPTLAAGVTINAGGSPLCVDGPYSFTAPTYADWDGDGKKDLIVGQYTYGNIWYFPNSGTSTTPVFTTGSKLTAGGTTISTSYG